MSVPGTSPTSGARVLSKSSFVFNIVEVAGFLSLKSAETDATKRALATFGNAFGLALYDRELAGVKNLKALAFLSDEHHRPWLLSLPNAAGQSFNKADDFIGALEQTLTNATDIQQLFAI